MGGHLALRPEIGTRPHQAGAEDLLPELVHDDPGGERVAGVDEPVCEVQAGGGRAGRRAQQRRKDRRCIRGHLLAALVVLAPDHHIAVPGHCRFSVNKCAGHGFHQVVALTPRFIEFRDQRPEQPLGVEADLLEEIAANPLLRLRRERLTHAALQQVCDVRGQRPRRLRRGFPPRQQRALRIVGGIAVSRRAHLVPIDSAAELRQRETAQQVAIP